MTTSRYVGIDVSKDKLDVAMLGDKKAWQVENAKEGIQKLVHQMQKVCPELIVVEATGGYQRAVVEALFHTGLAVAVGNPARVRQFARASGLLAKTDKLDAFVLAEATPAVCRQNRRRKAVECLAGEAQTAGRNAASRAKSPADHRTESKKFC